MSSFSREDLVAAVKFSDTDPDTESEIASVERKIGHRFPDAYRQIIGIAGEPHMGPVKASNDPELHFDFLPMKRERFKYVSTRLLTAHKRICESVADMRNVIPFGAVGNGDLVCFDYRTSSDPTIVLWNHERAFYYPDCLVPIADSFEAMLRKAVRKQGEPGATDNPDDAQRLREDH